MALENLTESDIVSLGINSFCPETGNLGTGFTFVSTEITADELQTIRKYKVEQIGGLYPFIYATALVTAGVGGSTVYPAYVLQKDV